MKDEHDITLLSTQPDHIGEVTEMVVDTISRQELLNRTINNPLHPPYITERDVLDCPSAQPERYTKEELRVFQHGISLRLLSKRSAQHWQYDEDTAIEIKFLERLYEKVGADIRGEEV